METTETIIQGQQELLFFTPNGPTPSGEARSRFLDPTNSSSPYYGYIGNSKSVNRLIRLDFAALGRHNHVTNDLHVAVIGPSGSGKTELVRRHNKARRLPLVEIHPRAAKTTHDIFTAISAAATTAGVPLVEMGKPDHYVVPPMDVFVDEVHALAGPVVQGLLKATEHADGMLVTERGVTVNCKQIHWIIATTDRGRLFDAFDTRFAKIELKLYTKEEMAKIVKVHFSHLDNEVCAVVAKYCSKVPREALAFAREMQLEYEMNPASWADVARKVAFDNDIDEFGITGKRMMILKALSRGAIAEKRLPIVAGVKAEELDRFIMPWLLEHTDDQPALVTVGRRGYCLTPAGEEEMRRRRLPQAA